MSFDKMMDPKNPKSHHTTLQGLVPGIILSIDDPEKLGRLQVSCPLLDPNNPVNNGNDGWCQVLERFVNADVPGGTQAPLQVGTQVGMIAMLGNPDQLFILGALPSTVSRPSSEVSRVDGINGTHTLNGRQTLYDQNKGRYIDSHPNGYTHKVDEAGKSIHQVSNVNGVSRTVHNADGGIIHETANGYHSIDATGAVDMKNLKSGGFSLTNAGKLSFTAPGKPTITLNDFGLGVDGQADKLSQQREDLKVTLGANIAKGMSLHPKLLGIAHDLENATDLITIYGQLQYLSNVLADVLVAHNGASSSVSTANKVSATDPVAIAKTIVGQIDVFNKLNLSNVTPIFNAIPDFSTADIGIIKSDILSTLPSSASDQLNLTEDNLNTLVNTLQSLQGSSPQVMQRAVTEALIPRGGTGMGSLNSLYHMGLDSSGALSGLNLVRNFIDGLDSAAINLLNTLNITNSVPVAQLEEGYKQIIDILNLLPTPPDISTANAFLSTLTSTINQINNFINQLKNDVNNVAGVVNGYLNKITDLTPLISLGNQIVNKANALSGSVITNTVNTDKIVALKTLADTILAIRANPNSNDFSKLSGQLNTLGKYYDVSAFNTAIINTTYVTPEQINQAINLLVIDVGTTAIPSIINSLSSELQVNYTGMNGYYFDLIQSINGDNKGGGIHANADGTTIAHSTGQTGGIIKFSDTGLKLGGPDGFRDLGGHLGIDKNGLSFSAPGGQNNIGSNASFTTKEIVFSAPGANGGLGSNVQLTQQNILLSAPGKLQGAGSHVNLTQDEVRLNAPGGDKDMGGHLSIKADNVKLSSSGGGKNAGAQINFTPTTATLSGGAGMLGGGAKLTSDATSLNLFVPNTAGVLGTPGTSLSIVKVRLTSRFITQALLLQGLFFL